MKNYNTQTNYPELWKLLCNGHQIICGVLIRLREEHKVYALHYATFEKGFWYIGGEGYGTDYESFERFCQARHVCYLSPDLTSKPTKRR